MDKEKKQVREVLKKIECKRFTSYYCLISYLSGNFPQYQIKMDKVKVSDLIDEEDYRYDITIGKYVGSIWFIKTRQKQLFITETMLD